MVPRLLFFPFQVILASFGNSLVAFAWSPISLPVVATKVNIRLLLSSRHYGGNYYATTTCSTERLHVTCQSSRFITQCSMMNHYHNLVVSSADGESMSFMDLSSTPFLAAAIALLLGIAAQGFINQMLEGDQGLGAYLKDGSGYKKSGFRQATVMNKKKDDPLPWLKLPNLDFVEVAGQENTISSDLLYQELENLRMKLNEQLQLGNVKEASVIRDELERRMKEAGIEFLSES